MFEPLFGPITQWGFLVKDIDAAMKGWVEHFGVGPWWGYRNVRLRRSRSSVAPTPKSRCTWGLPTRTAFRSS